MNGIIIIDKPDGWTSHDVVGKLRGVLGERRIGHGGTLDPMATGVLPVFAGRATRAVEFCENAVKEYVAAFRPGTVTDTQDITGNILERNPVDITSKQIEEILPEFTGKQSQIPPMYSAVKVNGKKLYELARKGVEVERKPREITIHRLELLGEQGGDYILKILCSKGTYIRTLCSDIGKALGCGGCMASLRRTAAGAFTEKDAVTIQDVIEAVQSGSLERVMRPVDSLFTQYPKINISGKKESLCRNGCEFSARELNDGEYRVYNDRDEFLMLGKCYGGKMKTVKSFFEV